MIEDPIAGAEDLCGIYKEIAEIIGVENAILLHNEFQGQQVTFPKKLYTKEYIFKVVENEPNKSLRIIAHKCGYTESHLRRLIREREFSNS